MVSKPSDGAGREPDGLGSLMGDHVDVRYYLDLLWRARYLIGTAAVVGLGLGVFVAFMQTPEYQSGALVQIDPPQPVLMSVNDALMGGGGYWQHSDYYNTQFTILRSRALGDQVVEKLKLADRAPFAEAQQPGGLFMSHVSVTPIPDSRLVTIAVRHGDPEEAALWANTLADVYVEYALAARVDAARQANDWLKERITATQESMRDSQDRLFKSYQSQDLFVPEGSVSAVTTSITQLNADYVEAQRRRITLDAAFKQADQMRASGEDLTLLPQVSGDGVVNALSNQIAALQVERSQLLEKFKPAHPEVQRLDLRRAELENNRAERVEQVLAALQTEHAQILRRERELRLAIEGERGRASDQSRKITELETLRREAESAKSLYDVLLQKVNETDIASSVRNNTITLVERAVPPSAPVFPNRKRYAGAGLLGGLLLGLGLVLARDFLDNTLRAPEEVERFLHQDLLAAVPRYDESSVHLVTEAYQSLRTALLFGRRDDRGQVVLVTGTVPQEGKTTTLVNVGKLLASSGEKTCVLDGDLRRAQLHDRLGLARHGGFTDYFVKGHDLEAILKPTRVPNLTAITSGQLPPNPPALLGRRDLPQLLDKLRERFEWVLIDSPPLASVTDALLLSRLADLVLFVVQHNAVDKHLVKRSLGQLTKAGAHVLGVVLNGVDVKSKGYYYHYYNQNEGAAADESKKPGPRRFGAQQRP